MSFDRITMLFTAKGAVLERNLETAPFLFCLFSCHNVQKLGKLFLFESMGVYDKMLGRQMQTCINVWKRCMNHTRHMNRYMTEEKWLTERK